MRASNVFFFIKRSSRVNVSGKDFHHIMRNIFPFVMAFAFAFAGECFAQTAKPADTAGVFVSIDTVKRDGIKAYADSQKGFEEAARKAAGCLRALFMQNAFYKDKFIRYAEFSSAADAKKFADAQRALNTPAQSETAVYEVAKHADASTPLIIAVDFDGIPAASVAEFMKISKPLRDGTNTEKDVLSYELYVSPENPARFFLFELYKNRAAHAFHSKQPHFTDWDKKCAEMKFGRKGKFMDAKVPSK